MLQIRYDKGTKELTGWWGERHGNIEQKQRPGEAIVMLDIQLPVDKPLRAFLFDGSNLVANPEYIKRPDPRDLATEMDELKADLTAKGII